MFGAAFAKAAETWFVITVYSSVIELNRKKLDVGLNEHEGIFYQMFPNNYLGQLFKLKHIGIKLWNTCCDPTK